MTQLQQETKYKQLLVDNAVCSRRFHLVYEENSKETQHVVVKCPHCDITLFEATQHPPVLLTREENLTQAPMGNNSTLYECRFNAS